MQVSSHDRLSALIEQKRIQQGLDAPRAARPAGSRPAAAGAFRFEDAADRARRAMAARNPALAAKLESAAGNRGVQKAGSVRSASSLHAGDNLAQPAGAAPVTRDLLAAPARRAAAPGLGSTIDTYA